MRKIYLDFLTRKKDAKKLSYDEMELSSNMSRSKLQRIFTGQTDPTVSDLETIVEKSLGASMLELYALMGEQEFKDSEDLDYKGAKELMADFAAEKEQIRKDFSDRIEQAIQARIDAQGAFDTALNAIQSQYARNAEYLTDLVKKSEAYNQKLTERAIKAEEEMQKAAERATAYLAERDNLDKRRHQVFWAMLLLVFILLGIIIASFILNIPTIGWGNP